jgi:ABC-type multidrug transport system ATPase subunit
MQNIWGKAEAGKTTAIMGASGAGKTSLFQALAGRISSTGKVVLESDVYVGGVKINPQDRQIRKMIAYVSQFDALAESSTPRESLRFSAKLRLPKTTFDDTIEKLVQTMIDELGLQSAADTIIGGALKKGISGGEKRRVSIGIELVASPSLIFLDEPTSGLDSFAAAQVMKLLDRVAKGGNTVLFTIHQPSSNVFASFDKLILLNKGQIMYQNSVSDIPQDFASYGYALPGNYNPADWVLDVSQMNSIEDLKRGGFFPPEPAEHLGGTSSKQELTFPARNHVSIWQEFMLLQQREFTNLYRNPTPIILNVSVTSFLAIVFGLIFFGIGKMDRSDYAVSKLPLGLLATDCDGSLIFVS